MNPRPKSRKRVYPLLHPLDDIQPGTFIGGGGGGDQSRNQHSRFVPSLLLQGILESSDIRREQVTSTAMLQTRI